MTTNAPPVTVDQLLQRATATAKRLQAHRDAMAEVAATAKATPRPEIGKEVTK